MNLNRITFLKSLNHRPGVRDVMVLMGGTSVAQAVSFLTFPILTRLFLPADIGALALFMSIVQFIATVAPFQLDQAIMSAHSDQEVCDVWGTFFAIGSAAVFVCYLSLIVLKGFGLSSLESLPWTLIVLLPLFTVPLTLVRVSTAAALREKSFPLVSFSSSFAQILATFVKIIGGLKFPSLWTLIFAEWLYACLLPTLHFVFDRRIFKLSVVRPRKESIIRVVKKYRRLLASGQLSILFYSLNQMLPFQYAAFLFSPSELGFFAFSLGLIGALARNIAQSLNNVFAQRFSQYLREGRAEHALAVYRKTIEKSLILGAIMATIIPFFAGRWFAFFFGERWGRAGDLIAPLTLIFIATMLSLPTSSSLRVIVRPKWNLWFEISQTFLTALLFAASLYWAITLVLFAWLFASIQLVASLVYAWITFTELKFNLNENMKR